MAVGPKAVERHRFVQSRKASLGMGVNPGRLSVSKGFPLSGSALPVLLDLFDKDYNDCLCRTRLRDGQIADLTIARDSDDEDEVGVVWAVTDAATWGLGANAYRPTLVVILDGGKQHAGALALGTTKTAFTGVKTGKMVEVQMAVVIEHPDGSCLISDILETSIAQSLTEPAFSAGGHITVPMHPAARSPTGTAPARSRPGSRMARSSARWPSCCPKH